MSLHSETLVAVDITTSTARASQSGDTQPHDACLEPDYRFTLANERTFLAWQRTALGLLAAAVGAVQFMPELPIPGMRHLLGAMVAVLAILTAATGLHRWTQVDHAIRKARPLPRLAASVYLAWGLVIVGMATVALTVTAFASG
jgi:putative membrane protein